MSVDVSPMQARTGRASGWTAEQQDARELALELAGLTPGRVVDTTALGVVLEPTESAYRVVGVWISAMLGGTWLPYERAWGVVTDRRLLLAWGDHQLAAIWWATVVRCEIDLEATSVVVDVGDGRPKLIAGPSAAVVAVCAAARLFGLEALATHPGIAVLRGP